MQDKEVRKDAQRRALKSPNLRDVCGRRVAHVALRSSLLTRCCPLATVS